MASSVNTSTLPVPPEIETTLSRLASHKAVRGVMVLSRAEGPITIIRHTGAVFEGEQGKKYAAAVKKIVDTCKSGLDEVADGGEEVKFLRIRMKKYELMISPDERYLLCVLQDPAS